MILTMKKSNYCILYYIGVPLIFLLLFRIAAVMWETFAGSDITSAAIFIVVTIFVIPPLIVAILMRFSPLRWYVDPFAAVEIPLFIYIAMVGSEMTHYNSNISQTIVQINDGLADNILRAINTVNSELADDMLTGFELLGVLFAFGLLCSFSIKRVKGESRAYRIIK